ncbi:MAG: NUDIX domain-containing protein [Brevundimonas sp.]|uniref:NUDIX domain-containing protein n=1 Tax=Brevundimonas sp. TaxID=1871086 RepID=UPI0028D8F219|nr:NUDIX domain-containing protein [uncultured Brevundimonas sp.]
MTWRIHVEPFTRPLFFAWSRLTRGKTLGVRAVAVDGDGRVLMVRHTYLKGWWLPGGGVDRGETTQRAVVRELREETGLIARDAPRLVSIHSNDRVFPGDHVAVFRIDAFDQGPHARDGEIAEVGWFSPAALPPDVNRGCRARLAEMFDDAPVDPDW